MGLALAALLAAGAFGTGGVLAIEAPATARQIVLSATGGGKSFVTSPPLAIGTAEFVFVALGREDGTAKGVFWMKRQRAGFNVEFIGAVTCMAVDPVNDRAWIGGVVLVNNSDDPVHTLAIHQPGQDVWFRVVDNGEGEGASPDRSSVYGFKGAGGIDTSPQYCATMPWPAGEANAFELTEGNIQVRSK
jgi:hypothetical protein